VSDPPDIGAYQNSIYLSGTLSANTTLNGNVAVTGNVTTPTNVTLTISPGTNMKFASGCSLTINGPCKAVGSSSQPVTFTSLSGSTTPGSWGSVIFNARRNDLYYDSLDHALVTYGNGIQCRNGTQVTISNSQINNCTYGFNLYQADAQILNNTVENPAQEGIYMDCPYYQPIILGNIIRRTTDPVNYAGFYAYGSGPEVINNYISGFYTGALFSSSYIESGQFSPGGCNNEITGNVVGLRADHVSLILLGGDCGGGGTIVPNNSIFGNTSYDLSICDTSLAEGGPNYFGAAPYNFDIDASSSVDFDTYGEWTSNPCGGSSKITNDPHLAHSSLKKTVTDNLLSGQLLEKQGRIDDAIAFYLELINNNDHVRFALLKLAFIMKKYSKPEITTSLENLLTTSNNNYCKIKNTLGNIYLQSNRFDDAITAFNDAIDHSSTDYDGINARFGKLFGYLNIGCNIPMASQVLSNIKGLNLTDNETLIRIKMA
ncbi:MAG: right-handed parallel beta-helix repeat-containing protein, partial [Ignavibacteriaceae bacterium]|nr:right-handed parallel beta-helix repeat-containing protein [Ignavibacteriaceae bacterium]